MNEAVQNAVREAMKRKGLTRQKMAEDLEIAPTNLSNILNGKTSDMPKRWREILDYLGLELTAQPTEEGRES